LIKPNLNFGGNRDWKAQPAKERYEHANSYRFGQQEWSVQIFEDLVQGSFSACGILRIILFAHFHATEDVHSIALKYPSKIIDIIEQDGSRCGMLTSCLAVSKASKPMKQVIWSKKSSSRDMPAYRAKALTAGIPDNAPAEENAFKSTTFHKMTDKQLTEEEAAGFRYGWQKHRRCYFTNDSANVFFVVFVRSTRRSLISLNHDEDIIDTDGKHQERNDLRTNQNIIMKKILSFLI
jgi:hypothetical protein